MTKKYEEALLEPSNATVEALKQRIYALVNDNDALRHERDELKEQLKFSRAANDELKARYPLFADLFYECDGPPRAYFELVDWRQNEVRGEYETLLIYADDEASAYRELRRIFEMAADLLPEAPDAAS